MQRACDFLARREHSRKELGDKLARSCADTDLIAELLETLAKEGLQSDERFAEGFVYHRVNSGQGPVKIRHELRQRGIDENLIQNALEAVTIDWLDLAASIRSKKFGETIPDDFQNKAKQSRFLYSRGFSSELINQLLKSP